MNTASPYRLIFGLAAIYNVAFGLWTCLWPQTFFEWMKMVPPNYPSLWSCLGMVVGLIGKILGPIGWVLAVKSGEWPWHTFPLVLCNDVVWWVPFALFLVKVR